MTINEAKEKLKLQGIPLLVSVRKGFDYFVPDTMDDIPLTEEDNENLQAFGVHLSETDVIKFAGEL